MMQNDTIQQIYNQLTFITNELNNIKVEIHARVSADSTDIQVLDHKIDSLQTAMGNLAVSNSNDTQIQTALNIMSQSYDAISNQITMVSVVVAIFALLFAIAAIWLSVYVSDKVNSVKKTLKLVERRQHAINETAHKAECLNNEIQNDIEGLYARLREEETLTLLRRIEDEPLDIINIGNLLFARCLDAKGYPILKSAFTKSLALGADAERRHGVNLSVHECFTNMFFQHYMKETIMDEEIRDELFKKLIICMNSAFKSDMIKSTKGLCDALSGQNVTFDKELVLYNYLKTLNGSKYQDLAELKTIFEEKLPQELLQSAIARCTAEKVYLSLFNITPPVNA